jgi:hypothetical protein
MLRKRILSWVGGLTCLCTAAGVAWADSPQTIARQGVDVGALQYVNNLFADNLIDYGGPEGYPEGIAGTCVLTCPGGATQEGETCGANPDLNGGCNSTPPAYRDVPCVTNGSTVCGKTWANNNTRDTDWYRIVLGQPSTITVSVRSEVPVAIFILTQGTACPPGVQVAGYAPECGANATNVVFNNAPAGTYRIFIGPGTSAGGIFSGYPCGNDSDYLATFTWTCGTPGGACCQPDGGCRQVSGANQCTGAGEVFTPNVTCEQANCPPPCTAGDCPGGTTVPEGETCGQDTNGGCNSTPELYTQLACGATVCGSTWASGGTRDTDWYEFTVQQQSDVFFTATSDVPLTLFFVSNTCPPNVLAFANVPECEGSGFVTANLLPGIYRAVVVPGNAAGGIFDGYPCDGFNNNYYAALEYTCGGGGAGRCCFRDGSCANVQNLEECVNAGGQYTAGAQCDGTCPQPCVLNRPGNAIDEAELCGEDFNGGCNMAPPTFEPLAIGATVWGNIWASAGTRDTDWYEVTTPADGDLTWTVESEFPSALFILNSDCNALVLLATANGTACGGPAAATATLPAGTYYLFVSTGNAQGGVFDGFPCDTENNYIASATFSANAAGRCCLQNGNCQEVANAAACTQLNGVFTLGGNCGNPCPPPCVLTRPGNAVNETENCGEDSNGGCNSDPVVTQPLTGNSVVVWGSCWATGGQRDTDWYEITVAAQTDVTWSVQSEFPSVFFILNSDCNDLQLLAQGSSEACGAAGTATANLAPGTYYLFVAPGTPAAGIFDDYPCITAGADRFNNDYIATLTIGGGGDPCAGFLRGDSSGDNAVNNFDIDPFVLALSQPNTYLQQFCAGSQDCFVCRNDLNGNGEVNNFDIDAFVACLTNLPPQGQPCP